MSALLTDRPRSLWISGIFQLPILVAQCTSMSTRWLPLWPAQGHHLFPLWLPRGLIWSWSPHWSWAFGRTVYGCFLVLGRGDSPQPAHSLPFWIRPPSSGWTSEGVCWLHGCCAASDVMRGRWSHSLVTICPRGCPKSHQMFGCYATPCVEVYILLASILDIWCLSSCHI
jgi:hypothetical protein